MRATYSLLSSSLHTVYHDNFFSRKCTCYSQNPVRRCCIPLWSVRNRSLCSTICQRECSFLLKSFPEVFPITILAGPDRSGARNNTFASEIQKYWNLLWLKIMFRIIGILLLVTIFTFFIHCLCCCIFLYTIKMKSVFSFFLQWSSDLYFH